MRTVARQFTCLLLLALAPVSAASAQTPDALRGTLRTATGVERLAAIEKLAKWEIYDSLKQALRRAEEGLALARKERHPGYRARFLYMASGLRNGIKPQQPATEEAFRKARELDRLGSDPFGDARFQIQMAKLKIKAGELEAAREYLSWFRTHPPEELPPELEVDYRYVSQALHGQGGNSAGALEQCLLGIDVARKSKYLFGELRLRLYVYNHHSNLDDREQAIADASWVLETLERLGLKRLQPRVGIHIALFHLGLGRLDKMEVALDRVESIGVQEPSESFKPKRMRALLANRRGEHSKAVEYATESVALAQEANNLHGEMDARMERAQANSSLAGENRDSQAMELAESDLTFCLEESRKLNDPVRIALFSEQLATLRKKQGELESVVQLQAEALDAARQVDERRKVMEHQSVSDSSSSQTRIRATEKASRSNTQTVIAAAVVGAILLLGIIAVILMRQRRLKAKHLLAQDLYENQSQLLRILGHDLRQPLQVILMYSNSGTGLEGLDASAVEAVRDSATSAVSLAEQLLSYARTDPGAITEVQPVHLGELFESSISFHRSAARMKGVELAVGSLDSDVTTSPVCLNVILNNLIFNAIKFTPSGGTIRVSAEPSESSTLISVSDSGVGMPSELVDRILSGTLETGPREGDGLGIGLSLIRRLAERLSNRLAIESSPGSGSKITIELPLRPRVTIA